MAPCEKIQQLRSRDLIEDVYSFLLCMLLCCVVTVEDHFLIYKGTLIIILFWLEVVDLLVCCLKVFFGVVV